VDEFMSAVFRQFVHSTRTAVCPQKKPAAGVGGWGAKPPRRQDNKKTKALT
jgi:hypothetical protein